MEVQLISQLLIKPSLPTPPHLQTMSISFFDQHAPPIMVPFIFYYLNHGNHPINSIQHTKRLSLLKKSLSDTLTLFYPFAGRYVKESFSVTCNDEGVVYSETLVNVQLFDILHGRFQIHELDSLVDKREESETSPLLTVQVNILKCGGLAIGIGTSHRIFDAFTSCLFTTAWAKACRTGQVDGSLVSNFDGGVLFPPRDNIERKKSPLSVSNSKSQVVTERFVFKQVRPMMPTSLVIATIWRAQIKAARARY